ncbi:MAG: hypothetical protein M1820_001191 [Bogoriella megaspora]|nr:MAG: hypothetical protein M1820_001191 [Bogoriella megaspora]
MARTIQTAKKAVTRLKKTKRNGSPHHPPRTGTTRRARTDNVLEAALEDPEILLRKQRAANRVAKPARKTDSLLEKRIAETKANINTRFRLEPELVDCAIAAVTEAQRPNSSPNHSPYSLLSLGDESNEERSLEEEPYIRRMEPPIRRMARGRKPIFWPYWYEIGRDEGIPRSHGFLVVYELINPDGPRSSIKATVYDNEPGKLEIHFSTSHKTIIRHSSKIIGEFPCDYKNKEQEVPLTVSQAVSEETVPGPAVLQVYTDPSDFHVVVNAWVRALGLRFNPDPNFTVKREFYDTAAAMIARAIRGQLDSKTLYKWLVDEQYVLPGPHRAFKQTRPIRSKKEFNYRVEELIKAGAK